MTADVPGAGRARNLVIGLASFLTLIDLFGSQALLPALTEAYSVEPSTMGFAVNASTIGMAVAGIAVALFGRGVDRKRGISLSLVLLAIPTSLLAAADSVAVFAMLRIVQGVLMSTAFTLTMAYLAEECTEREAAGAMAAYITGNVASNLFGRMMAVGFADHLGLANSFYAFAVLNIGGAALVYFCVSQAAPREAGPDAPSPSAAMRAHLTNRALSAGFAIGFLILFAFIGVFTYVNFVLVTAPFFFNPAKLGFVYLIFLPAMLTTPLAGNLVALVGVQRAFWLSIAIALAGLAMLVTPNMVLLLTGLALVAVGTFSAQAVATGYVSKAARHDRAAASGLYLASYYLGGLVGSIVLGQVFDAFGWTTTVVAIAISLVASGVIAVRFKAPHAGTLVEGHTHDIPED